MHADEYEEDLSQHAVHRYVTAGHCDGEHVADDDTKRWPTATSRTPGLGEVVQSLRSLWYYHQDVYTFHTPLPQRLRPTPTPPSRRAGCCSTGPVGVDAQPTSSPATQGCDAPDGLDCLRQVLLLGNPVLWWGGCLALVYAVRAVGRRARLALRGRGGRPLSTWLPWLLYDDRPIFFFYAVAMPAVHGAGADPGDGQADRHAPTAADPASYRRGGRRRARSSCWCWSTSRGSGRSAPTSCSPTREWLDRIWFSAGSSAATWQAPPMAELVEPTVRLHASWLESRDEWGRGAHQDGSGLRPEDEVDTAAGFAAWVDRLRRAGDRTVPPEEGKVHATHWWVVEGERYLGAISLRHELNDFLLRAGGHIGYGIRPSARRRGLATWALERVLDVARARGLDRVLITCEDRNVGSARVIESQGGVLEDVRSTELGQTRRYWVDLTA